MSLTIYHNPRCSKSRKTLQIINEAGMEPMIVLYLQDPPDAAAVLAIAAKLGIPVADLLRHGESALKDAIHRPNLDDDTAVARFIAAHPTTLQRPIVIDDDSGRAVIGRPPENVTALLP